MIPNPDYKVKWGSIDINDVIIFLIIRVNGNQSKLIILIIKESGFILKYLTLNTKKIKNCMPMMILVLLDLICGRFVIFNDDITILCGCGP